MTTLRELVTVIGFDVDEVNLKKAEKGFNGLKALAVGLVGAIATVGIGVVALAKNVSDAGDDAAKMAERVGVTATEIQELGFAADLSGTSIDALGMGLKFLQRNAFEAKRGSKEAAEAFALLGVRVTDGNGRVKPTVQLFEEVSDAIAKIDDPAKRTALSMRIMGRSGDQLIPLMKEGGAAIRGMREEAHTLGFILNEQAIKASEALNDDFDRLSYSIRGVKNRLAVELFPIVSELVVGLKEWIVVNRELIDSGIRAFARAIETAVHAGLRFLLFIDRHRVLVGLLLTTALIPLAGVIGGALLRAFLANVAAVRALTVQTWRLFFAQMATHASNLLLLARVLAIAAAAKEVRTAIKELAKEYVKLSIAQLRAAATATLMWLRLLAPIGLVAAGLAAIALIAEDIFYFASGGESAIGNLRKALVTEAEKPSANWFVKTIAFLIDQVALAVEGVDGFFRHLTDAAIEGGNSWKAVFADVFDFLFGSMTNFLLGPIWGAIGRMFVAPLYDAVKGFVLNDVVAFNDMLLEAFATVARRIGEFFGEHIVKPIEHALELLGPVGDLILRFAKAPLIIPGFVGGVIGDALGSATTSGRSIDELGRTTNNANNAVTVGGANVEVNVQGGSGAPAEIKQAAKAGVEEGLLHAAEEIARRRAGEY